MAAMRTRGGNAPLSLVQLRALKFEGRTMDKDDTLTLGGVKTAAEIMTGAQMVVRALRDQGVTHIFGYPGGAVLPIYDALFKVEGITHVLVRHEQGAVHA